GTAQKYLASMRSFGRFAGSRDLMLFEVTAELIEEYQQWLVAKGVCMNTVSFYMRTLRAVFNRAVKRKLTPQTGPFSGVYTGVAMTRKRAVGLDSIQRIKDADLGGDKKLEFARDLFLFSFYCRGMAFVDMANLSADSVSGGYLSYCRQKTGQRIVVKWEPPMQAIVDRYSNGSRYLLPIISAGKPFYGQYMRMNKSVARWLKKVGEKALLGTPLTLYVARHSWTSIAKQRNHPLGIISRALGHTSERTTQIYLASLDNTAIDDANSDIISGLK
ncbi:MAG: site-specific integrase, partial [Bacteroidales bacterium]|nr:site-specific integrase [Bacteroidales bacterium]